jgi:hypothetical protein
MTSFGSFPRRPAGLWLKWFQTLKEFPPLQAPETYNLNQGFTRLVGLRAV